jgi:hypothetical protein
MGWCRGDYYQRSRRRGGRVVTEYVGGGFLGALASILDEEDREERQEQREAAREALAAELAALEAERSRGKAVSDLVFAVVESLGYARYTRNPWKRRRTMKAVEPPEEISPRQARADIRQAVRAARTGDQTALAKLKELGSSFPAIVADEAAGAIDEWAEAVLNATLTGPETKITCPQTKVADVEGPDLVRLEGIRCQLDIMWDELAAARSSLAVKLAADAVLFSWRGRKVPRSLAYFDQVETAEPLIRT